MIINSQPEHIPAIATLNCIQIVNVLGPLVFFANKHILVILNTSVCVEMFDKYRI